MLVKMTDGAIFIISPGTQYNWQQFGKLFNNFWMLAWTPISVTVCSEFKFGCDHTKRTTFDNFILNICWLELGVLSVTETNQCT